MSSSTAMWNMDKLASNACMIMVASYFREKDWSVSSFINVYVNSERGSDAEALDQLYLLDLVDSNRNVHTANWTDF